eukprot:6154094-Amphidinium_carterae.1
MRGRNSSSPGLIPWPSCPAPSDALAALPGLSGAQSQVEVGRSSSSRQVPAQASSSRQVMSPRARSRSGARVRWDIPPTPRSC